MHWGDSRRLLDLGISSLEQTSILSQTLRTHQNSLDLGNGSLEQTELLSQVRPSNYMA